MEWGEWQPFPGLFHMASSYFPGKAIPSSTELCRNDIPRHYCCGDNQHIIFYFGITGARFHHFEADFEFGISGFLIPNVSLHITYNVYLQVFIIA